MEIKPIEDGILEIVLDSTDIVRLATHQYCLSLGKGPYGPNQSTLVHVSKDKSRQEPEARLYRDNLAITLSELVLPATVRGDNFYDELGRQLKGTSIFLRPKSG